MTDLASSTLRLLRRNGRPSRPDAFSGTDPGVAATAHGQTHPGRVRERNEDQFLIATLERLMHIEQSSIGRERTSRSDMADPERPQGRLFIVADGMGGIEGGDVASAVAIDAMAEYAFAMMPWVLASNYAAPDILGAGLRDALHECEARIHRVARRKGLDENMGTTLTIAYVTWPVLHVVHVGDSRCYLLRNGTLTRLTRDHTIAQELVDKNALTEDQAAQSRFASMLTNAVGGREEAIVDLHRVELAEGDELMLCTDGLSGALGDRNIQSILASSDDVADRVAKLVDAANGAGGDDNITVVLARF